MAEPLTIIVPPEAEVNALGDEIWLEATRQVFEELTAEGEPHRFNLNVFRYLCRLGGPRGKLTGRVAAREVQLRAAR